MNYIDNIFDAKGFIVSLKLKEFSDAIYLLENDMANLTEDNFKQIKILQKAIEDHCDLIKNNGIN